jgi:hypothetical protein
VIVDCADQIVDFLNTKPVREGFAEPPTAVDWSDGAHRR